MRVHPDVCTCMRIHMERGFLALNRSRMTLAHMRRAALNLAISSKKSLCDAKKKLKRGAKSSTFNPLSNVDST